MRGRSAIGVHDDLAAGQAGVAVGAADHELAGGVDVPVGVVGDLQVAQRLADERLHDFAHLGRVPTLVEVLGGKHDLRHLRRHPIDIGHRDLALGVGA